MLYPKVTDPLAGVTEACYDENGNVKSVTDANGGTTVYSYDEMGRMVEELNPIGSRYSYTYNAIGRVMSMTDELGTVSYTYDRNGNLTRTVRPNGTEEICTYNAAGLLTEQKDVKGEEVLTHYIYTYDGYGNVTAVEGTETTDTKEGIRNLTSATMTYDAANRLLTYNGEALQYDADGNMTYGPVEGEMQELTYDCRNRLISAGGVTYTYDAENIRIKAETAEYVEEYVTDTVSAALSRVLTMTVYKKQDGVAETAGTTTTYLYGQGLIREETEGNYLYHHYNNLGSTMKLTDASGNVIASYTYGVYGELLSGDSTLTHFLYNGRCGVSTDANGLYYMRQRYYNPEIKRFINQDILTGSLSNSQSLNRYSYVQGNPVSYTDPFGLSPVNGLFSNSNNIHGALTLAGFTPGPGGAIADLLDTFVYLLEGDIGGAIGAGIAIFASGLGLAYKTVKAVGKADKVSDTAKLVKNTVNAFSESGSFMKAASNGADAAQTLKAVKQGRVVDKLKDSVSAAGNKLKKLAGDTGISKAYKEASSIPSELQYGICFVAGTQIKTEHGNKSIEEIRVGDRVYSKNTENGECGWKKVVRLFSKEVTEIIHIQVGDEQINTTPTHPFWVDGYGFKAAEELVCGDYVETADGRLLCVTDVRREHFETPVKVYNFEVEDWHTYYVSEEAILVHNMCALVKNGTRYSDEELIKAAKEIHYAQYGSAWWGKKNPVAVTQAIDGTVVVSKNNGIIGRKSRQKAIEIFGEDVIIVKGRGVNYNNATNIVQTASPNHAEARGIQALLSRNIDVSGARQATTLPSCVDCRRLQELLSINNITDSIRGTK